MATSCWRFIQVYFFQLVQYLLPVTVTALLTSLSKTGSMIKPNQKSHHCDSLRLHPFFMNLTRVFHILRPTGLPFDVAAKMVLYLVSEEFFSPKWWWASCKSRMIDCRCYEWSVGFRSWVNWILYEWANPLPFFVAQSLWCSLISFDSVTFAPTLVISLTDLTLRWSSKPFFLDFRIKH